MAVKLTNISIFISCPGNLNELRGVAERAIKEVSDILRVTHGYILTPISWKQDIVPGAGVDGQDVINKQTIGEYDIYLGIIGSKFGTKTVRAGSGTEEEFDIALSAYHLDPTQLRILFYLQGFGANPFEIDPGQLAKVQQFKQRLQSEGILYRELLDFDEALKALKAHLLKLVHDEWDDQSNRWKTSTISVAAPSSQQTQSLPKDENQIASDPKQDSESIERLGLFDLIVVGNEELGSASGAVSRIGANLTALTEATQTRFEAFGEGTKPTPNDILVIVDGYSSEIDIFLQKSRGEMANGRYHLFRGCDLIEAYHRQVAELGLTPSESPVDIVAAIEGTEPSLRSFRNSVQEAKSVIRKLPPMTTKFKVSQQGLMDYFDEVIVELTVFIERLVLLKSRLVNYVVAEGLKTIDATTNS